MQPGKKRILLTIAEAGSGHRSAAQAITDTFHLIYPGMYDVTTVDLFANAEIPFLRNSSCAHEFISKNPAAETLLNLLMRITSTRSGYAIARRLIGAWTYGKAADIIMRAKPDLVVNIHALVGTTVRRIKEKSARFRSAQVITDLVTLFPGWADPTADLIVCPTEEAVAAVKHFGIPTKKIICPFFPIKPTLIHSRPKEEVLRGVGLDPRRPTVLVTGGGVGTASMVNAIKHLSRDPALQIIVVTGNLPKLKSRLAKQYAINKAVKVFGYVNNIQDYMRAADIAVAKPGPATILELELCGTKALITRKIGLQETGNIRYALRNPRFRYIGDNWNRLQEELYSLLNDDTPAGIHSRKFDECEKIVHKLAGLIS